MRGGREVAAGAQRAGLRDARREAGVEQLGDPLQRLATDAGVGEQKAVEADREGGADDLGRQLLAAAGGVRTQQVDLQLVARGRRDGAVEQRAEAGRDPVYRRAGADELLERRAVALDPRERVRVERDGRAGRDRRDRLRRQRTVERDGRDGRAHRSDRRGRAARIGQAGIAELLWFSVARGAGFQAAAGARPAGTGARRGSPPSRQPSQESARAASAARPLPFHGLQLIQPTALVGALSLRNPKVAAIGALPLFGHRFAST